jgi:hypothetical protein
VAVRTQRLEFTRQERVPVTAVGLNVVGDSSRDGEAARLTHAAQRFDLELVATNTTPAF